MKAAALVALIIAILGMILNLGYYALNFFGIHTVSISRIIWPAQIIMGGLPIIILSIGILGQKNLDL